MRKRSLMFLGLVLIAGTPTIDAQSSQPLIATIPFGFNAGEKAYPPGEYEVQRGPSTATLTIRMRDGSNGGFVMVNPVQLKGMEGAKHAQLLFNRYGSKYFLREVWHAGDVTGLSLRKTREEVNLAAQFAPGDLVVVARPRSKNP
jgi:hypothetical protein